jgi:hypothetical protein
MQTLKCKVCVQGKYRWLIATNQDGFNLFSLDDIDDILETGEGEAKPLVDWLHPDGKPDRSLVFRPAD